MKICWDTLESVRLTRKGNFRKGTDTYTYYESCEKCGEPYLAEKRRRSKFCGRSCAMGGKNNIMYESSRTGSSSPNYKGGAATAGLTSYDGYKDTLDLYEDTRKQDGTETLEVKCTYCGKWYAPTYTTVNSRLAAINNLNKGEQRLYCSENCKRSCPTYGQRVYPKGFKQATSREVSTYLRQMVLERDNWTCQICGKTINEAQLHCHHMDSVAQNKMFQNDVDSCITLCKNCHKSVHKQHGCRYVDLQCKSRII